MQMVRPRTSVADIGKMALLRHTVTNSCQRSFVRKMKVVAELMFGMAHRHEIAGTIGDENILKRIRRPCRNSIKRFATGLRQTVRLGNPFSATMKSRQKAEYPLCEVQPLCP